MLDAVRAGLTPTFTGVSWAFAPSHIFTPLRAGALSVPLATIPVDPYDFTSCRFRCGARGTLNLSGRRLAWNPPDYVDSNGGSYFVLSLSKNSNPEYGGRPRAFRWFSSPLLRSTFFPAFLSALIDRYFICDKGSLRVSLQIIVYRPRPNVLARATPNLVHYDEVGWSSITILQKGNISGGEMVIFNREAAGCEAPNLSLDQRKAFFPMADPLDTVIFNDDLVAHYVTEMTATISSSKAIRAVLIVDYECSSA